MCAGLRAAALGLALALAAGPLKAGPEVELLGFGDLDGWAEDDHAAAFAAFVDTCPDLQRGEWVAVCAFATTSPDPRAFFESFFRPVLIGAGKPALFTAYYEPVLPAAPQRTGVYRYPVYRPPPDLVAGRPWLSRAEIEENGALAGRGLEIAWLRDPYDVHHLMIQGSGRLRFPDGRLVRLGYAAQNGHPRRSVAAEMVRRGHLTVHEASGSAIRNWLRRNPAQRNAILRSDPSFVFFRELPHLPEARGPLGAMNRPLHAQRSIAVDPAHVPLGAPVWVETRGADPLRKLMVAHDTGGAIKGPQRADLFLGTGEAAGEQARVVRDRGRMVVLLPIEHAFDMALGGSG